VPLGTSFTVPLYAASAGSENFIDLRGGRSNIKVNKESIIETNSAGAGTTFNLQYNSANIVGILAVPPQSNTANANGPWVKTTGNAGAQYPVLISTTIPTFSGTPNGQEFVLDGNWQPECHDTQTQARGASADAINQLPTLYACMTGCPGSGTANAITSQYLVRVAFNLECVVRPEVASYVGSTSVPNAPAAVTKGRSIMNTLGDLGKTLGRSALTAMAPYATEMGSAMGRAVGSMILA
jgi:hypothetical protein